MLRHKGPQSPSHDPRNRLLLLAASGRARIKVVPLSASPDLALTVNAANRLDAWKNGTVNAARLVVTSAAALKVGLRRRESVISVSARKQRHRAQNRSITKGAPACRRIRRLCQTGRLKTLPGRVRLSFDAHEHAEKPSAANAAGTCRHRSLDPAWRTISDHKGESRQPRRRHRAGPRRDNGRRPRKTLRGRQRELTILSAYREPDALELQA